MVNVAPYVPQRGDVVWITLNPRAGHEQAGRRPAVVLSPQAYNGKVGLAILCPITSQVKNYPFEVRIPSGWPIGGVILSDQVKSMDWRARKAEWICSLSLPTVCDVLEKLGTLLG
jgi:mRNA interferase MazF